MTPPAWLGRASVLGAVASLGLLLPSLFFDDAYITFRYAANLAAGEGFSYNPGESVLGVTTPLLTFLLALAARLGADLESAAFLQGLAGHALLCLLVFEAAGDVAPASARPSIAVGLTAAMACALHPHMAITAAGGMETPMYGALLIAALWGAARGRPVIAGAALGLALLARPDAILAAPVAAWVLSDWADRRTSRTLAAWGVAAAAVAGPWMFWAWRSFGSPVPHAIAAKRLIHPRSAMEVLGDLGRFVSDDPYLLVALPLAALGLVVARHQPMAKAAGAYLGLYVGAMLAGGVEPFPWYANPAIPFVLMLAAAGLAGALALVRLDRPAIWTAATVLVVAVQGLDLRGQVSGLRASWEQWEGAYEVAARWLLKESRPGDRIYVGEVGVIGYLLPGRVIIDSSGINSPEVYRRRLGTREEDPEWSRRVVQDLRPDFIATSIKYLHIGRLAREPWFEQQYEKTSAPLLEEMAQVIYRRRDGP